MLSLIFSLSNSVSVQRLKETNPNTRKIYAIRLVFCWTSQATVGWDLIFLTNMLRFVILGLVALASGNVIHEDKCPELKPVENFNLTAYLGTWYEISKFPYASEKNGKCASAEYKLEGDIIRVKNTHVVNGVQTYIEGTVKLAADANKAGKLVVSLKFGDVSKDSPLMVLVTDYAHYAIAYNCKYDEKNKNHQDFAWILSRSKTLEGEAKTAVDNYIKAHAKELDATKLVQTDFSEEACKFNSTSVITETVKHH